MENIANIPKNTVLSSVSMTLRSQNGHFSVKTATYTLPGLGLLQWGTTATATQQITGVSNGTDVLLISAKAYNPHPGVNFSDTFSPAPSIVVSQSPVPELPTSTGQTILLFATALVAALFVKMSSRQR